MEFNDVLKIPPIPLDSYGAAIQALSISREITDAGDWDTAIEAVLDAIKNSHTVEASSVKVRLWQYYQNVYTEAELRDLIKRSWRRLSINENP